MFRHMYNRMKEFFSVGVFLVAGLVYCSLYLVEKSLA